MRSTIICVDDEKMLLNILAEQLQQWFGARYNIEKALSGEDALQILDECIANNSEVSLIVSDYVMPGMRGDELLNKVSKRDPRIRKIMLTGYSSVEGIANVINNGGLYRYITKPWDTKDLMLTIVEAIRSFETDKKNMDLTKGFETMFRKYESLYMDSQRDLENAINTLSLLAQLREPDRNDIRMEAVAYMGKFAAQMEIPEPQRKLYTQMATLCEIAVASLTDAEIATLRRPALKEEDIHTLLQIRSKFNGINDKILSRLALPDQVKIAVMHQFERMDGSGPLGLNHHKIPQDAFMLGLVYYFAECKTELIHNRTYTRETAIRTMNAVINKKFPSDIILPFVEVLKAEFAQ